MANPATPPPSFSSLPDEIIVNCLAGISISYYRDLCLVSKSFCSLLSSRELYVARSQIGNTEPRLYLFQTIPTATHHRWFSLYDPGQIKGELSLVPVKLFSSYFTPPLNATNVAVGSEIYQIGGSNNYKRSRAVCVLDCRSHTWRCGPKMMVARESANSCFLDGKIYVMGGCRRKEEAMNWGEVLDLKTQTWKPLPSPCDDGFDPSYYYEVVVLTGKLYVITDHNKYVYDPKVGRWLLDVEFTCPNVSLLEWPWCVIENVVFTGDFGEYYWYDSKLGNWLRVQGLEDLNINMRDPSNRTIQLANYGGKLAIFWHELIVDVLSQEKRLRCAVIRLEKRLTSSGPEIWGQIERCSVVVPSVPDSYELLAAYPFPCETHQQYLFLTRCFSFFSFF